jgi:hypothetical protein
VRGAVWLEAARECAAWSSCRQAGVRGVIWLEDSLAAAAEAVHAFAPEVIAAWPAGQKGQ